MSAERVPKASIALRRPRQGRIEVRADRRSAAQPRPPERPSFQEAGLIPYEQRLADDPRWALSEGSEFFMGTGSVQDALRKITRRLDDLQVPYAIVGGMALFLHGYRRFTEDVDILVGRAHLKLIHERLEGAGYLPPFHGSKHLRDTEFGVKIEFLVSGDYPGDGKPKPVAFPDPALVAIEKDGIKLLGLPTLIELKLASGMTNPDRQRDLNDVQELIKALSLPLGFSQGLSGYVQDKYIELWQATRQVTRRYMTLWRNKWLTAEAQSLDQMIDELKEAAAHLQAMKEDGVILAPEGGTADDYAYLVTTDPEIAKKYDMHPEDEFLEQEDAADAGPPAQGLPKG